MNKFIKYCLSLCIYIGTSTPGYCNTIDTLSSKESVRQFLSDNLSGIVNPNLFFDLYRTDKKFPNIISGQLEKPPPDTYYVQDPVTQEDVMVLMDPAPPPDSFSLTRYPDTQGRALYPYDETLWMTEHHEWSFYKKDVDGDGHTDLIIDAGGVLVVLDKGGHYEGHLLTDSPDFYTYNFSRTISLPDGTQALLLKRISCIDYKTPSVNNEVSYITDTTSGDTLYKTISTVDSIEYVDHFSGDIYKRGKVYTQAIDMHKKTVIDTIVYKYNGFAKYNLQKSTKRIVKILYQYVQSTDMGNDGITSIEINKDGKCYINYRKNGRALTGVANSNTIKDLWNFTEYADISSYESNYSCWIDHYVGCVFVVYFDDGTAKGTSFQGFKTPIALGYLSQKICDISFAIDWQLADGPMDISIPGRSVLIDEDSTYDDFNNCDCLW